MREISFRIWDSVEKKLWAPFDTWKERGTYKEMVGDYAVDIYLDGSFVVTEYKTLDIGTRWICRDSEDFELMQYIGLKDKNGKDIYEGDVVQSHSYKFEVKWKGAGWKFIRTQNGCVRGWATTNSPSLEVIGNIYENPKLLEDK